MEASLAFNGAIILSGKLIHLWAGENEEEE